MRYIQLARPRAFCSPELDELAILGVLHDASIRALAVGDENVSIRPDDHVARTIQCVPGIIVAFDTLRAELHQQLPLRAELHDLVQYSVGDPYVVLAIDPQSMCRRKHPVAP